MWVSEDLGALARITKQFLLCQAVSVNPLG